MRIFLSFIITSVFFAYASVGFANTLVSMETTAGTIVIELNEEKAPETVANFKRYVEEGFYDGTIFHRVISDFMIQGGGMTSDMKEKKTHSPVKNEADNGLVNSKYTIAMARTNDPNSATSQFFINTQNNAFLNFKAKTTAGYGYCVFGKVIEGESVVDKIERSRTQTVGYFENVPVEPIVITKVTVRP